jgi:hypothetical protein
MAEKCPKCGFPIPPEGKLREWNGSAREYCPCTDGIQCLQRRLDAMTKRAEDAEHRAEVAERVAVMSVTDSYPTNRYAELVQILDDLFDFESMREDEAARLAVLEYLAESALAGDEPARLAVLEYLAESALAGDEPAEDTIAAAERINERIELQREIAHESEISESL